VQTGVQPDQPPDHQHHHGSADRHAAGRRSTARALAGLTADGWLFLHDLPRPGRRFATIDHVAVGPGGVVVVDTKSWAGVVDVLAGTLRLNGAPRDRECELALASAAAVTAWLEPSHRTAVVAVLALAGHRTPAEQPTSMLVYGVADLPQALRALPARLAVPEVGAVADRLRRTLSGGSAQLTTAALAFALAEAAPAEAAHAAAERAHGLRLRGLTRIRRTRR